MGDAVDSKQKILDVAEKIFAEKGFDGARVSEIASGAGVNKALIYYYFDSKDEILESLFSSLIDDFISFSLDLFTNNVSEFGNISDDEMDKILDIALDYILSKKDILSVAMIESMKTSSSQSIIIKIGEMFTTAEIEEIRQTLSKKGLGFSGNIREIMVSEFFTGTLPLINYAIFKDDFTGHFNMTDEEYREYFINAYKGTHVAHHMKNYLKSK